MHSAQPDALARETLPMSPQVTHVFFDAEGTLWEPKPGRGHLEFWEAPSVEKARDVFQLTDGVVETLTALRDEGRRLVVVSHHDEKLLPQILALFQLNGFFDDVLVNGNKGTRIAGWLQARRIPAARALMVGDRYEHDIEPVEKAGIRAVLLDRAYNQEHADRRVRHFADLRSILEREGEPGWDTPTSN